MSNIPDPMVWTCVVVDYEKGEITYAHDPEAVCSHVKESRCHCQNLLAGHDEWCSYHKTDYEDPRTRTDLWGIKRVESKTRAEINAEYQTHQDAAYSLWGAPKAPVLSPLTLEDLVKAAEIAALRGLVVDTSGIAFPKGQYK